MKYLSVLAILVSVTFSASVFARGSVRFGDHQSLSFIQDVELKGQNQEALYLGYHTTTKFFIAGVNITDNGYVLAVKNSKEKSFYTLSSDQISSYQSQGLLPNPLPIYTIKTIDLAIGYSLWIFILLSIIYYGGKGLVRKRSTFA